MPLLNTDKHKSIFNNSKPVSNIKSTDNILHKNLLTIAKFSYFIINYVKNLYEQIKIAQEENKWLTT